MNLQFKADFSAFGFHQGFLHEIPYHFASSKKNGVKRRQLSHLSG
jgi:hypothetical protein